MLRLLQEAVDQGISREADSDPIITYSSGQIKEPWQSWGRALEGMD